MDRNKPFDVQLANPKARVSVKNSFFMLNYFLFLNLEYKYNIVFSKIQIIIHLKV